VKAIYLALQCFTKNLTNQYILIRSDNTTAVSYINRMGSVRFPKLANLARKIWRFCEVKNNFLTSAYIPTGVNLQDDRESRTLLPGTEWSLSDIFRQIISHVGRPEIDLFFMAQRPRGDRCRRVYDRGGDHGISMPFRRFASFCGHFKKLFTIRSKVYSSCRTGHHNRGFRFWKN
jgi:hypothetical protein